MVRFEGQNGDVEDHVVDCRAVAFDGLDVRAGDAKALRPIVYMH